jgi:hypothetical protein
VFGAAGSTVSVSPDEFDRLLELCGDGVPFADDPFQRELRSIGLLQPA